MNQEKIVEISEKLLSRLLEFKNNNQGFTFSLRQRDSPQAKKVKRLEKGQWFQGSDYIYLPLFRKGDSVEKTVKMTTIFRFKMTTIFGAK